MSTYRNARTIPPFNIGPELALDLLYAANYLDTWFVIVWFDCSCCIIVCYRCTCTTSVPPIPYIIIVTWNYLEAAKRGYWLCRVELGQLLLEFRSNVYTQLPTRCSLCRPARILILYYCRYYIVGLGFNIFRIVLRLLYV